MKSSRILFGFVVSGVIGVCFDQTQLRMDPFLSGFEFCLVQIVEFAQNEVSIVSISVPAMRLLMSTALRKVMGGKQLTLSAIQEKRTIRTLAAHILELTDANTTTGVSGDKIDAILAHDSILPPEI